MAKEKTEDKDKPSEDKPTEDKPVDDKSAAPEPEKEAPAKETGVSKTLVAQACKDLKIDPESVVGVKADGKALVLELNASAGGKKVRWEPKE